MESRQTRHFVATLQSTINMTNSLQNLGVKMIHKVLFMAGDPDTLDSFERELGDKFFIKTAQSGEQGLKIIKEGGPYAVVVTDMNMPGMNGIEFLKEVREFAPETVRMMLTRFVNTDIVMRAINEGNVYKFLSKSATPAMLTKTLEDSIAYYQSIKTEKESLSKSLVELLGILNPMPFSKTLRFRQLVSHITREMKLDDEWQFEMAATLSQIGLLTYPSSMLEKIATNQSLSQVENRLVFNHSSVERK
jgi:response regulator RpfG family c-di-GMP phosphodiesterase